MRTTLLTLEKHIMLPTTKLELTFKQIMKKKNTILLRGQHNIKIKIRQQHSRLNLELQNPTKKIELKNIN